MGRWHQFFNRRKRMMENLDQDIRDFIQRETQDNIERGMARVAAPPASVMGRVPAPPARRAQLITGYRAD
ncbi:MAG: hypothetical protein ABSE79_00740 [Terriglobia bacterium]|jgi:hypothetical protein